MDRESNILSSLPENIWLYRSAFILVGIYSVNFTLGLFAVATPLMRHTSNVTKLL